jgi:hypothetical protein
MADLNWRIIANALIEADYYQSMQNFVRICIFLAAVFRSG